MSRKKLVKLLGKDVEYTATFKRINENRAVLIDLKHKGKYLCDHVNVSKHYLLTALEADTEISFNATAYTYRDSKGVRKHGLSKCHKYMPVHEGNYRVQHDNDQKRKRNSR